MMYSISPYALLKRSKPKPPAVYTADYDLYSAAQHSGSSTTPDKTLPSPTMQPYPQAHSAAQAVSSFSSDFTARTHYISGIRQRHSKASGRTKMSDKPLPNQSSPASLQTPLT